MFSSGVSNIKVTNLLSANPIGIGYDIATGIAKAGREQEIREQVEKTQGLTGFEIFGQDYKQKEASSMSSEQGFCIFLLALV